MSVAVYTRNKNNTKHMTQKKAARTEQGAGHTGGIADLKIAIVAARDADDFAEKLVRGAVQTLIAQQFTETQLRMMWSPSLFQLPLVVKSLAESGEFDGVIVIGAATKSDDTDKYLFETAEVYRAVMDVMMLTGMPMSCGLVSAEQMTTVKKVAGVKKRSDNPGSKAANELVELLLA
jgi:6,7-dimethyl-8-ribityllumazine synthase